MPCGSRLKNPSEDVLVFFVRCSAVDGSVCPCFSDSSLHGLRENAYFLSAGQVTHIFIDEVHEWAAH